MRQLKTKPIKLICLVLALIFTAVGCQKKAPEPPQQAGIEAEGKATKSPELVRRTITTKPLHQAAEKGDIDQVQSHISKGADLNAKDDRNNTPLHYAAWKGHKDVAQILIANGAQVNGKGVTGGTPLHMAAIGGQTSMLEFLIAKGADINVQDDLKRTPLGVARLKGNTEVAELLLRHGAKE